MTAPAVPTIGATELYATLVALEQLLAEKVKPAWFAMTASALQQSFVQEFLPRVIPDVATVQTSAASVGAKSVRQVMAHPAVPALPDLPQVNPTGFAGFASDGGSLPSLLAQPLIDTYVNLDAGMPHTQAMQSGYDSMDRLLTTQVQDSARVAQQVQMAVDPRVTYYVRVVEPGACGRCLILSGRKYRWSKGFLRHPRCRCHMAPETDANPHQPSVENIFDRMTPEERAAAFGAANAQAIEHGADISRVVNATGSRAGMSTTISDGYGNTYKGTLNGAAKGQQRLVPESIFQLSAGDRDEAIRLLQLHGYIT